MEQLFPLECFRKKVIPSEAKPFSPFAGTTKIFCSICLDCQCQAFSREKAKNLQVFCLLKPKYITVSVFLLLLRLLRIGKFC